MEDKKMTEKESLELITSMIQRTRERYIGDGNILLMWGYLTVFVTALVWIMLVLTHDSAWNWLWFLIGIVGGIATPIMSKKSDRKSGVKSYSDKITSQIWTTVGIASIVAALFCFGFALKGFHAWGMMFAIPLLIVPMAEISQGIIVKEKSLIVGGAIGLCVGLFTFCCLVGNVRLLVNWFLPLFMVAFACMMIIPGHIVNHKARQQR
ncbi:MAG: hypothetical protein IKZ92_05445 [Muribaculaceae bacterium]|nr:hypothetical protein [Muribaculaceae bacterium]